MDRLKVRLAVGVLVGVLVGMVGTARALEVGAPAPAFTLTAPDGRTVTLAELTAQGPVVLYTFLQAFTGF